MHTYTSIAIESKTLFSRALHRKVVVEVYLPQEVEVPSQLSLLLLNDGQNLAEMKMGPMLDQLISTHQIQPLLCAGIFAGEDRLHEYGTAAVLDYEQRGTKAAAYQQFILEELIPFLHITYGVEAFTSIAMAGFSMGGLSALDTVWNHPHIFSIAGVFSGSLWWRSKGLDNGYIEEQDRIMHQQIRKGSYRPGLRFYFTTGSLDETADRNKNGIIDSIDDTLALIDELATKGYHTAYDIAYINYEDGRHDIATWSKALPHFLLWGWGRKKMD